MHVEKPIIIETMEYRTFSLYSRAINSFFKIIFLILFLHRRVNGACMSHRLLYIFETLP